MRLPILDAHVEARISAAWDLATKSVAAFLPFERVPMGLHIVGTYPKAEPNTSYEILVPWSAAEEPGGIENAIRRIERHVLPTDLQLDPHSLLAHAVLGKQPDHQQMAWMEREFGRDLVRYSDQYGYWKWDRRKIKQLSAADLRRLFLGLGG